MTADYVREMPGARSATATDRLLPRGRHDLPPEFVARTQRDRLLDAMAHTVAARGYAGAALGEVCTAAGVSTKAFYQHFADKEACFLAAFDTGLELLQRQVVTAYGQPGRWPVRMRRGLEELLRVLSANPAFAALAVVEVTAAGPRALARRRALLDGFLAFFAEAPHRAGQPVPPPVAVEAVVAGVYGVIFDYAVSGRLAELPDELPALTYAVLSPFIGMRAAADTAGLNAGQTAPAAG
ncbi:TetR/AcrR family transcriptional regulator [Catenuloplanes japonicus]|uniref:TetR/AcrR family transcriptional regulator n=1 Tax=Catenuloplanes japonicus TaxID=33876 RepID=UPI000524359E|nr:TetR/AcrR family transcriptional regulator [Catenuloplanes japonicus]